MSNAASSPEFKKILKDIYASGQAADSGEALRMAWAEYRQKHHGGVVTVQQRRYAERKSFENPRRKLGACQCSDTGCPIHEGSATCPHKATAIVYRSDMEDRTGTAMCAGCKMDAMDSGVFYTKNPRRKNLTCKACGGEGRIKVGPVDSPPSKSQIISCHYCKGTGKVKNNPEMRPRIQVTKKTRRGKLRKRSPLKGFRINPFITSKIEANNIALILRDSLTYYPYVNVYVSTLGGQSRSSVLITVSLDKKSDWPNGIIENSRYGKFHLDYNGRLSMITGHNIGKLRSSVIKSTAEAVKKINSLAGNIKSNPIVIYNPKKETILPAKNIEIRYQRSGGKYNGQWFKHPFKGSVRLIGLPNGNVLIKSNSGKKLWGSR